MKRAHPLTSVLVLSLVTSTAVKAQEPRAARDGPESRGPVLPLPPRPPDAPAGGRLASELAALDSVDREARLLAEISAGNVPSWLRELRPIEVTRSVGERVATVRFWTTPDYLAVGSDHDFFLAPMRPRTAQAVADLVGALLPTTALVDAIWAAADVRLTPAPIPPSPAMTSVRVFQEHDRMVGEQRSERGWVPGHVIAGHKKDVVVTNRLDPSTDRVAIYGWHEPDGVPIQPLYTGHTEGWVDYSHGVRLVWATVTMDGVERELVELLADPALSDLVSDEGVVETPRYGLPRERGGGDPGSG